MVKSYIFEAKLKNIDDVIIDKSMDEFVRKITKAMDNSGKYNNTTINKNKIHLYLHRNTTPNFFEVLKKTTVLDYFKSQFIEEYGADSLNKSSQSINSKLRKLYDRMITEQNFNIDEDEDDYVEYGDNEYKNFKHQFDNKTHLDLCIEKPLDTIISNETSIILNDIRDDMPECMYLTKEEAEEYNYKMIVNSTNGLNITLKDCLETIMNSEYYNIKSFSSGFDHRFLEDIYQDKTQDYHLFLGS